VINITIKNLKKKRNLSSYCWGASKPCPS